MISQIIDILSLVGFSYAIARQVTFIVTEEEKSKYMMIALAVFNFCLFIVVFENILTYPQSLLERILLLICAIISALIYKGSTFEFLNLKVVFFKLGIKKER